MTLNKETVKITKIDGTEIVIDGSMNDKLFAHYAPKSGWKSYVNVLTPYEYEMSEKDKELKDYCDHYDAVNKVMNY